MIERFDARAQQWCQPFKGGYYAVKWLLVSLGAFIVCGLSAERLGRAGAIAFYVGCFGIGLWRGLLRVWPSSASILRRR